MRTESDQQPRRGVPFATSGVHARSAGLKGVSTMVERQHLQRYRQFVAAHPGLTFTAYRAVWRDADRVGYRRGVQASQRKGGGPC